VMWSILVLIDIIQFYR